MEIKIGKNDALLKVVNVSGLGECCTIPLPVTLDANYNISDEKEKYEQILELLTNKRKEISHDQSIRLLADLIESGRKVGVDNKFILSKFDLKSMYISLAKGNNVTKQKLLFRLEKLIVLQRELRLYRGQSNEVVQLLSIKIVVAYFRLMEMYPRSIRKTMRKKWVKNRLFWVNLVDRLMANIGSNACNIGAKLRRKNIGVNRLNKSLKLIGFVLQNFFSYEALRKSQLETSLGWRNYIPGTLGAVGNVGGWIMMATGNLEDLQALSQPMRINPGGTLYLPWVVGTINRPGFGWGPVTPIASAYTDKHRFKLLVGIDGVLYVRIGEWAHRGSYFTISASIPVFPGTSITWNASLFSPGFEPVLRFVTPYAHKIQNYSEVFYTKVTYPLRLVKSGYNKLMRK